MAVCMKFRFIPANTEELNRCSSGTRSDKQIERKILHVHMDLFFFFFSRVLLCLFESPRGDRIYCLCTARSSRKGMPQAEKIYQTRK